MNESLLGLAEGLEPRLVLKSALFHCDHEVSMFVYSIEF